MNQGLSLEEAQKRLAQYGRNVIKGRRQTPLIVQFFKQFADLMVIILIIASVFAYFAGENVDAIIIIGIVLLNATIGFLQEFKAEKAIEALKKLLSPKSRVMRGGAEVMIPSEELVPGDIVILAEGDKVSADCELIECNEIKIDESILTGESVPVGKTLKEDKKLFMGTQVTHGTGIALVVKTGMGTEFGRIATLTSTTKKDKSPLQKELIHIGVFVGKITFVVSGILFLVGFFLRKQPLVETLLFAVSVAVAAVPEGLPTTITIALALGVQRLARKNAIMKQLNSVETLGSTTVICSDKTGTLTKNEMTVQEIYMDEYTVAVNGVGYEPRGTFILNPRGSTHEQASAEGEYLEFDKDSLHEVAYKLPETYEHFELIIRAGALCNNARLTQVEEQWKILGDPTEGALVTLAEKSGVGLEAIFTKHKRIIELPFDSNRKRMSVVAQEVETGEMYAYVKGAPDSLLELCTETLENGELVTLTPEKKRELLARNETMANRALRTIAIAYKHIKSEDHNNLESKDVESDLILLGFVGMIDPPREEVKEAVKLTHKAGIRIFIITGDHGLTAHAIARELGIVKSYGVNIVTGEMLNTLSDEKLAAMVAPGQETIFARVSPEHKLRIVDTLKKAGEVVAVTGDGVNDAPALKRADIGIAMGITGTDVSKEAANMVLADDSFSTIVTAIIEGRTIYENMKKFIFFIFSSNIGEVLAVFATIMIGLPPPVTAVLILIINTLTDVFPALALAVEPVDATILNKPPRNPHSKIMEGSFVRRYLASGAVIGFVTAGVFLSYLSTKGWHLGETLNSETSLYRHAATMAFVVITLMQMTQVFNSRSDILSVFKMNFFNNPILLAAVSFSILATVALVELPFFQTYLKTESLTGNEWGILILCGFIPLIFEEIRKFFARRRLNVKY